MRFLSIATLAVSIKSIKAVSLNAMKTSDAPDEDFDWTKKDTAALNRVVCDAEKGGNDLLKHPNSWFADGNPTSELNPPNIQFFADKLLELELDAKWVEKIADELVGAGLVDPKTGNIDVKDISEAGEFIAKEAGCDKLLAHVATKAAHHATPHVVRKIIKKAIKKAKAVKAAAKKKVTVKAVKKAAKEAAKKVEPKAATTAKKAAPAAPKPAPKAPAAAPKLITPAPKKAAPAKKDDHKDDDHKDHKDDHKDSKSDDHHKDADTKKK